MNCLRKCIAYNSATIKLSIISDNQEQINEVNQELCIIKDMIIKIAKSGFNGYLTSSLLITPSNITNYNTDDYCDGVLSLYTF